MLKAWIFLLKLIGVETMCLNGYVR